jgi:hypothetical protein
MIRALLLVCLFIQTQAAEPLVPPEAVTLVETPLAGQAYLALAGIHRKQGKREQAARPCRIQALNTRPQQ